VWEDPNSLDYETDYGYDVQNDLLSVNQKGDGSSSRTRSFVYDSLSRLTSATNPESGLISYTYSGSSGGCAGDPSIACTKAAPAPAQTGSSTVTATYLYDALNRLTKKSYSDGTTPAVTFGYDNDQSTLSCTSTTLQVSPTAIQLAPALQCAMAREPPPGRMTKWKEC
jgi:YD repeat-containing protein